MGAPPRTPTLLQSAVCFLGIIFLIAFGLFWFKIGLHSILFGCLIWVGGHARYLGLGFADTRELMGKGISRALPAIYIFILIGMVIASFMHSGTIASLIYYGLDMISPRLFLVAGLVLCSLMSVATGTSWGTVGTLGVVLMGLGETLGIPLPLIAGMVVSGATFGDKLSPISDTTNLAAMSAGTDLYRHIRSMLYTTVPTFVIVILVFLWFGQGFANLPLPTARIEGIKAALDENFVLSPWITLSPLALMLGLSLKRYSAEVSMSASVVLALLIAIFYQQHDATEAVNALWRNTPGQTGIESLDALLGRGGMSSMSWTLFLALMALALGGVLHGLGILQVLLKGILSGIRSTASLIGTTIASAFIGNLSMGEAYISIILNCQLFRPAFKKRGVDPAVLSRSVEEGATLTTGLIPWTTAGAFYTATLGVPVLDYAPYALLNYLNPFVSVLLAWFGIGLLKKSGTITPAST